MLKDIYLGLKFAFSYFTILPISFSDNEDLTKSNIIKSLLFFLPFVGLVLGLITIFVYHLLEHLDWLGAIISAIVYMLLYGFLHTEAIVDVADALYAKHSGKDDEEVYKIIKEPTIGAMGLLYGTIFVIAKTSVIVYTLLHGYFYELVLVLMFSRLAIVFNIMIFKSHSNSSFIALMKSNISSLFLAFTLLFYIAFYSVVMMNFDFVLFCMVGIFFISTITIKWIKSHLGFVNGDVIGTSLELSEVIGLIMILSF